MKDIQFPLFATKGGDPSEKFDLTDVEERKRYFEAKAGEEIRKLREYMKENTFIVYLLGKKNSGKGTYSKMIKEIVGKDLIDHLSVGDMVRDLDETIADPEKKKDLVAFLEKNYRGPLPLEDIIASLESRSTKSLLPTELILALIKKQISERDKKTIFIDGFPRNMDQVSYSLFFRDLIDYREDPDVFVLIDVPRTIIDARIKSRRICPLCHTSRNLDLLPTKEVGYDKEKDGYYLVCDNSDCEGAKMETKEGDELGIEPLKKRLEMDEDLVKKVYSMHGIKKVLLRNDIPVDKADETADGYEFTPGFVHQWDEVEGKVKTTEKPWEIEDDEGTPSYSLMPPPVVVSFIKQLVRELGI